MSLKVVTRAATVLALAAILPACGGAFGGFYIPLPNAEIRGQILS